MIAAISFKLEIYGIFFFISCIRSDIIIISLLLSVLSVVTKFKNVLNL